MRQPVATAKPFCGIPTMVHPSRHHIYNINCLCSFSLTRMRVLPLMSVNLFCTVNATCESGDIGGTLVVIKVMISAQDLQIRLGRLKATVTTSWRLRSTFIPMNARLQLHNKWTMEQEHILHIKCPWIHILCMFIVTISGVSSMCLLVKWHLGKLTDERRTNNPFPRWKTLVELCFVSVLVVPIKRETRCTTVFVWVIVLAALSWTVSLLDVFCHTFYETVFVHTFANQWEQYLWISWDVSFLISSSATSGCCWCDAGWEAGTGCCLLHL